jgi:hypothetical protein
VPAVASATPSAPSSDVVITESNPEVAPKDAAANGGMLLLLLLGAYFFPAIVAGLRHHHNGGAIFLANLFFGWTLFGWLLSLIWAATNPAKVRVVS